MSLLSFLLLFLMSTVSLALFFDLSVLSILFVKFDFLSKVKIPGRCLRAMTFWSFPDSRAAFMSHRVLFRHSQEAFFAIIPPFPRGFLRQHTQIGLFCIPMKISDLKAPLHSAVIIQEPLFEISLRAQKCSDWFDDRGVPLSISNRISPVHLTIKL